MPYAKAEDGKEIYYETHGQGPALMMGYQTLASEEARRVMDTWVRSTNPEGLGIDYDPLVDGLVDDYRVIVSDYPYGTGKSGESAPQVLTPERVVRDYLAVADAAGAPRFAWFGYSWGGVVGFQLGYRHPERLTALIVGGWMPLDQPMAHQVRLLRARRKAQTPTPPGFFDSYITFYEALQDFDDRKVIGRITCPRMTFAGEHDHEEFVPGDRKSIIDAIVNNRPELERLGWQVHVVPGRDHVAGLAPDVVLPLIRGFLDPILLSRSPT